MRQAVAAPSQTLEESFPLLESADPGSAAAEAAAASSGSLDDFVSAMSGADVIPMDRGASQEMGMSSLLGGQTATEEPATGGDDLTRIEGIGPAIAQHLKAAGIESYSQLAATTPERIQEILDAVGGYGAHDPTTWPDQSQLAAAGEWDQLGEWQSILVGGRVVEQSQASETVAPASPATPAAPVMHADDLTKIEGIGPKIAEHLNAAGIINFAQLAVTNPIQIRAILDAVGGYAAHDPSTWPDQAQLASVGEWDKLQEWQIELDGGRPSEQAPAPVVAPAPAEVEDLTKIEGIGPKIAEHLNAAGIVRYDQLAQTDPQQLMDLLMAGGFAGHNSETWADQAQLAAAGQWDQLSEWQDQLDGGKIVATDDLTKVEGIGPKVAELLNSAGILSYSQLAATTPEQIAEILSSAGGMIANMNPSTWPDQAQLAASGEWDKLKEWQDELDGGV
jgi:DNA-directed RNA polymerase subunit beta'